MSSIWYVLAGFASGIISGMGIGGGAILIPALTIFLGVSQQEAQHINLLYFIPTAALALVVHKKNDNIETGRILPLLLWGLPTAIAGALVAVRINGDYLRKGFAVFLLAMAAYELTKGYKKWKTRRLKT